MFKQNSDASNSKEYYVTAIWDSTIYVKPAKNYLSKTHYQVL